MSRINNNVFVTRDGNICEKSRKGRRLGTYVGAAAAVGCDMFVMKKPLRELVGSRTKLPYWSELVKGDSTFFDELLKVRPITAKILEPMSKVRRLSTVSAGILGGIGLCALVGRGIGKIADKIIDRCHAKQADAQG